MKRPAILLSLILALPMGASTDIGTISFPTSTPSKEAQAHFQRGATILHSFGWKQAIQAFQEAQAADPDFAMAYWGEALCYNHPLLPERDRDTPQEVLQKLGPTLEARLAKAPTMREKGFLRAVDALFFGEGDIKARRVAYMEAMRDLHEAMPDDDEVAAFYALSLISAGGAAGKEGEPERVLAGSIGLRLLAENANHPGAAHYTIHAFDDPTHAILALPAARKFAGIAPGVSHARHMPSHIFIQLGMWQQVSDSNQSAYEAAVDLYEPGDSAGDMVHALDWGQYGDLQLGDYERARQWIERMEAIAKKVDGPERIAMTLPTVKARYVLETGQWRTTPVTDSAPAAELFASGISAIQLGDLALARAATRALGAKDESETGSYFKKPLEIMKLQLAGAVAIADGDTEAGFEKLTAAAAIAQAMPLPRGAPNPIKPAHELLGEALLQAGRPADAVVAFEESLTRMRNRPRSLLGLARANTAIGEHEAAQALYAQLMSIWKDRDLPELSEVRRFLASN